MDFPEILSSIASAAVTLAGFAAVFKAFSGGPDADGQHRVRLNIVIEGGLTVSVVCFLPVVLASLQISDDTAWRLSSGGMILWTGFRLLWTSAIIVATLRPLPELFLIASPLGLVSFLIGALNISGISDFSAYSLFLTGVLFQFSSIATVFVAQFRVEKTGS